MQRTHAAATIVALSLLALAAVAGATAADGTATARQAQNATNDTTPEGWFADERVDVEQGEVAAIDLRLEHTDDVTVVVGSNASTHRIVAEVTDGNGDGKVGVQFDTAQVGPQRIRFSTFREADSVEVRSRTGHTGVLPAAGYSLQLYLDEPSGQPANASLLVVDATATPTTTTPTTETTTDGGTTDATSTTADTTTAATGTTDSGGQPGFGLVAGLVGVVAAALLATRR